MSGGHDGALLKGAAIRDARNWLKTTYGNHVYPKALASLSTDEQAMIDGPLLASSWYPMKVWDRFLAEVYKRVEPLTGESVEEFDMRNVREAGSTTLTTVYKFIVGLMSATAVMSKLPTMYGKVYSPGRFSSLVNQPGRAVLACHDALPEMRGNVTRFYPVGARRVLEMNGVRDIRTRTLRDEVTFGQYAFEFEITYTS